MSTKRKDRSAKKVLTQKQRDQLLGTLKERFEKNLNRHKGIRWTSVQERLEATDESLWSLELPPFPGQWQMFVKGIRC